jgi:UPF0755 protein
MSGPFSEEPEKDPRKEFWYRFRSAFAVIMSLAVLFGGGWFVVDKVQGAYLSYKSTDDYLGDGVKDVLVRVPDGASVSEVGDILLDADVIKSMKAFRTAVRNASSDPTIQAGQYKLKTQMSAAKALEILSDPANIQHTRVTLTEGLTVAEQTKVLARATTLPAAQFTKALANTGKLGLPNWAKGNPEGFMFPDTYEVADRPTALGILQQQTRQFTKVTNTLNFTGQASTIKRTPYEALTVASILEKEGKTPQDKKIIAGIIYNRLAKGMPLQSDATVLFANNATSSLTTTDAQRKKASPYNTYLVKGLPPTPINNPGAASMEAAVSPAKTNYLYWVVIDPEKGTTAFATTVTDHNKNVAKFQQWCQAHKGKC